MIIIVPRSVNQGKREMARNIGQGGGAGRGGGGGGIGRGGGGGGRGGGTGLGPGGKCVCPSCGTTVPHKPGSPCVSVKCPKCGTSMIRAG